MSRSYKKFIVSKDQNNKFGKRQANRTVRRAKDVPNGRRFKRFYCSWDISDWRFTDSEFYTAEQFRRRWYSDSDFWHRFRTWKEAYRHWLRWYRMK